MNSLMDTELSEEKRAETWRELLKQAEGLLAGERNFIANVSNLIALIYNTLPAISWCGVYLADGEELILGPFQGQPACVRIPFGKGVCGAVAASGQSLVVADVHRFPGHIACDATTESEIVVPLLAGGRIIGVWDMDSRVPERFDETDEAGLEPILKLLVESSDI